MLSSRCIRCLFPRPIRRSTMRSGASSWRRPVRSRTFARPGRISSAVNSSPRWTCAARRFGLHGRRRMPRCAASDGLRVLETRTLRRRSGVLHEVRELEVGHGRPGDGRIRRALESVKGLQRRTESQGNEILAAEGVPVDALEENGRKMLDLAKESIDSGSVSLGCVMAISGMRIIRDDALLPVVRSFSDFQ